MLDAFNKGRYSDFVRDFSPEFKKAVSESVFKEMTSDFAVQKETLSTWCLLDTLDRGEIYRTEVWKIVSIKNTQCGKTKIDRLFYVTQGKLDGEIVVIGFKFDNLF